MKAFKAYFLHRLLLEKILLTGFVLLIAVLWLSNLVKRAGRLAIDFRDTTAILSAQSISLAGRADTEAKVKRALAQLDPARTLDGARLQGDLNTMATGLPNTQIDARGDEAGEQFIKHSVQFTVRKVDWGALQHFYVDLSKRAPYINIEECTVAADKANRAELSATMLISSVEIVR
jgi:hypothetical protein